MNERFKYMTGISDIVDAMVKGLQREWVEVNMMTFGHSRGGVCFGCAATNTLCQIMGEPFTLEDIDDEGRARKFNYNIAFIDFSNFETSIDQLRRGNTSDFLGLLRRCEHLFSFRLPSHKDIDPPFELPALSSGSWKEGLRWYEKYRDWLKEKGL